MAVADTTALMGQAIERLQEEVPALKQLRLMLRVEFRARRGDVSIGRVERPGPRIDRDRPGDARVDICVARSYFELAANGRLKDRVEGVRAPHIRVSGDAAVTKLLGNMIEPQMARG
jgi:hypothetical protein